MSVSVELGLLLALLTAFGSVAGFLYKFRGAREAPAVDMRHPLSSSVALFRSPLYTLGIVIALGSWGCTWVPCRWRRSRSSSPSSPAAWCC